MAKRYLMIHADDAGLALSHNRAIQDGMLHGSISSCSLMVPTPWFYEMAQFCLAHPELDYGIHLTLTGEWKYYPFRPLCSPEKIPTLISSRGYLHPNRTPFHTSVQVEEVYLELKCQIQFALNLGLKPSHLDSHMYVLGLRQDLLDVYEQLGKEFELPILYSSPLSVYAGATKSPLLVNQPDWKQIFMASYTHFENEGLAAFYDQVIGQLPEGLSQILIHPAYASASMEHIAFEHPNFGAAWREDDAAYFISKHCQEKLDQNNIELVGWKDVIRLNLLHA